MKRTAAVLAGLCCFTAAAKADTVSILFDAGILKNATGTAVVPNGSLCEIIASPSGVFSTPTSDSYVTGDNVLVRSFAMNSNSGIAGETLYAGYSIPTGTGTSLVTGESLALRFYPNITYATAPTAPTALMNFGQVRSDTIEFGSAGGDGSETIWKVPSAGATVDMDYITANDGGTYADATAYAAGVVLPGVAVPEPGTLALLGGAVMGYPILQRRARRTKSK